MSAYLLYPVSESEFIECTMGVAESIGYCSILCSTQFLTLFFYVHLVLQSRKCNLKELRCKHMIMMIFKLKLFEKITQLQLYIS